MTMLMQSLAPPAPPIPMYAGSRELQEFGWIFDAIAASGNTQMMQRVVESYPRQCAGGGRRLVRTATDHGRPLMVRWLLDNCALLGEKDWQLICNHTDMTHMIRNRAFAVLGEVIPRVSNRQALDLFEDSTVFPLDIYNTDDKTNPHEFYAVFVPEPRVRPVAIIGDALTARIAAIVREPFELGACLFCGSVIGVSWQESHTRTTKHAKALREFLKKVPEEGPIREAVNTVLVV